MSDENLFDYILDINSPDFAEQLTQALGVKPGDVVSIRLPQFDRTDGVVPAIPDIWDRLRILSASTLKIIGCAAWDVPDEKGDVLMLFPKEWYDYIPDGFMLECISGESAPFKRGETDDDYRFGCLAYGIRVPAMKENSDE